MQTAPNLPLPGRRIPRRRLKGGALASAARGREQSFAAGSRRTLPLPAASSSSRATLFARLWAPLWAESLTGTGEGRRLLWHTGTRIGSDQIRNQKSGIAITTRTPLMRNRNMPRGGATHETVRAEQRAAGEWVNERSRRQSEMERRGSGEAALFRLCANFLITSCGRTRPH